MNPLLRIPVNLVAASLVLSDGSVHEVSVYVPSGSRIAEIVESSDAFMTATAGPRFLMFAREGLAAVSVSAEHEPMHDLPLQTRGVRVQMTSGVTLSGHVRYLPSVAQGRVADYLNDGAALFVLRDGDSVTYVAKKHVAFVEETS